jgi:hypothetical protein
MQSGRVDGEDTRVEPVGQRKRSKINVVIGCRRSVDDHGSPEAIPVLDGIV